MPSDRCIKETFVLAGSIELGVTMRQLPHIGPWQASYEAF